MVVMIKFLNVKENLENKLDVLLQLIRDILAGEVINESMLTFKRPGTGISPIELDKILENQKIDIKEDTLLKYSMLE